MQSAASTASAFSAQFFSRAQRTSPVRSTNNKTWLGRKDSNLRTLGSEPSAVAAVLLPNIRHAHNAPVRFGCGSRYRAGLSAFSEQRFHLISFPAMNSNFWRARGESNPRRGRDSAPSWPLEDAPVHSLRAQPSASALRAKLGIPLRTRTGISSFVNSRRDPLDQRDTWYPRRGLNSRSQIESLASYH